MTCSTCRRLRKRVAEELAKFKAAIAGPTKTERAIAERRERISRRQAIRALLAGVALTTGLARTVLELVDDAPLTFKGVPFYFEDRIPELDALEAAWKACATGGGKPDYLWIDESQLEQVRRHWKA